jgi:hypothetical protein
LVFHCSRRVLEIVESSQFIKSVGLADRGATDEGIVENVSNTVFNKKTKYFLSGILNSMFFSTYYQYWRQWELIRQSLRDSCP